MNENAWIYNSISGHKNLIKKLIYFCFGWIFHSLKLSDYSKWGMIGFEGSFLTAHANALVHFNYNYTPKTLNEFCQQNGIAKENGQFDHLRFIQLHNLVWAEHGRDILKTPEIITRMIKQGVIMLVRVSSEVFGFENIWTNLAEVERNFEGVTFLKVKSTRKSEGGGYLVFSTQELFEDPHFLIYCLFQTKKELSAQE